MAAKKKKSARASVRKKSGARSGPPPIVYIHGIGQQAPKHELKSKWDLALFGQDMHERTRMAYWADLLHAPATGAARAKSMAALAVDRDVDARELLRDAGLRAGDADAERFVEALSERLASRGSHGRSGPSTKALPLPGFLRRPIARRFLKEFVPDTAAYFFKQGMRAKIQRRLIAELPKRGAPFVIVSHSMGTVIAFEVLSDAAARIADVDLLVTLGSPLGVQEVQDFLNVAQAIPKRVRSWHNFADPLDPVALDKGLTSDFEPRGTIRDNVIFNERTKEFSRFNPHSSFGYLAHPRVRSTVHGAVQFDTMGRFVVARDVAEAFVDTEHRHPVLIEVLYPGYHALGEERGGAQCAARDRRLVDLPARIEHLAGSLRKELARRKVHPEKVGRVDELRHFVAAHLVPDEVRWVAENHADLAVYSVWRSAQKRKLLWRSHRALKVDAARNSYQATGQGITWAVLDTGARSDHPHLAKNIEVVWDCTKPGKPKRITSAAKTDPDGHGTHVAGIIAGAGRKAKHEPQGVAPQAQLVVYKVLDDEGFGEDAWIIKALDHVAATNDNAAGILVHGVNLSLGGPFDATVYGCGFSPICQELRRLWQNGVVVCVAAGNEGQIQVRTTDGDFDLNTSLSIGDPANLDECIAVGSVNADKPYLYGISFFSSRGPTADGRKKPDVVAPGERISSCNANFKASGKTYRSDSGTSMACPHVSGLLAAFLSVRPEYIGRPDDVKRILLENANDLNRDPYHQGAGLPNLMKMLLNS
jgi:pimeloyl-ACP methyl ester carboxylesterase